MVVIEDELHDEKQGEFPDLEGAIAELRRLAAIPWDEQPNIAPCTSWRTCGRVYKVVEYDHAKHPAKELRRLRALEISSTGIRWVTPFGDRTS